MNSQALFSTGPEGGLSWPGVLQMQSLYLCPLVLLRVGGTPRRVPLGSWSSVEDNREPTTEGTHHSILESSLPTPTDYILGDI